MSAYNSDFWLAVAAASPVIMLAQVSVLGSVMPLWDGALARSKPGRTFGAFAIMGLICSMGSLVVSLDSLSNKDNELPLTLLRVAIILALAGVACSTVSAGMIRAGAGDKDDTRD